MPKIKDSILMKRNKMLTSYPTLVMKRKQILPLHLSFKKLLKPDKKGL